MSVGKSVYLVIGVLFLAIFSFGCSGDQGSQGPEGFQGPPGPPGNNYTPDPIATQTFGLMITNGTPNDYNGAAKIEITSAEDAVPSATRVVARLMTTPPSIDGVDGGSDEWGDASASLVTLGNLFGADNGVSAASVRFGYDRQYVYAMVSWQEFETESFLPSADTTKNRWSFDGTNWSQAGGEDQLFLVWELNPISGWDASGVAAVFNGTSFKTSAAGERADLWLWQATQSNYALVVGDYNVGFSATDGKRLDVGSPYSLSNDPDGGVPRYMKSNSLLAGSTYPLRGFEFAKFDASLLWSAGATIPGYVTMVPSGSAADIHAVGKYLGDTWVVELRRARNTGNADDLGL